MNLAHEVKRHLDVLDSGQLGAADSKFTLLDFFDKISVAKCFRTIDKLDFVELKERSKGQKRQRKQLNNSCMDCFETIKDVPEKTASGNSTLL